MSDSTLLDQSPTAIASASALRQVKKVTLYVEGQTDYNFFSRVCGEENCNIKDCNGADKVIASIKESNLLNNQYEIGVADKDYNELLNSLYIDSNICYTDTHDMETLILSKKVFNNLLFEYGDMEKIKKLQKKHENKDVLTIITDYCRDIGYARLYCRKNSIDLDFSNMDLENYINAKNLSFDFDDYLTKLIEQSSIAGRIKLSLFDDINNFIASEQDYNTWDICQGHDVTTFIAFFFKNFSRQYKEQTLNNREKVESHLRTLFVDVLFKSTQLYDSMKDWENNHLPNKLFCI